MNRIHKSESGFTLIEALIAFAVLAVGMLGALLFHSALLSESGQSKARALALKIAEERLEELRDFSTQTEFTNSIASLATATSVAATGASGVNAVYTVQYQFTNLGTSSASNVFQGAVNVSWNDSDGNSDSVTLATNIAWINPLDELDPDEAGKGVGTTGLGAIDLPTGKAKAVARVPMAVVSGAAGTVYQDDKTVGIVLGDGSNEAIQLIELNDAADPVIMVSGRIANNPDRKVTAVDFDYFNSGSDVIDIRSSAGSNCLIYNFVAANPPSHDYEYGDYVCLMSEGWNGNISVSKLELGAIKTFEDENNIVCYSSPRGYKYLIVEIPDGFNAASSSLADLASGAVKGQSGVVRFVADAVSGYHWDDYFWHNPQLLSVASSPHASYGLTLQAGDVFNQSFVVSRTGGGISDCDDHELDYSHYDGDERFPNPSPSPDSPDLFDVGKPVDDENNDSGDVILGYTPVRFTISGFVYLDAGLPVDSDEVSEYSLIGNPEPVVSVTCDIDSTTSTANGTLTGYPYTCQVPVQWKGALIAQPLVDGAAVDGCPDAATGSELTGVVDANNDPVSVDNLDEVAHRYYDGVANDDSVGNDFAFVADGGTCSVP